MAMIAFSSAPQGHPGDSDYRQIGTLTAQSTVQWAPTPPNGIVDNNPQTVLSVKADGTYKTEPLGTAGQFETVKFDGSALTIRPRTDTVNNEPTIGYVISARALP